jgi:hypothetical protein
MEQRTAHNDIKQILQLRISFLTIWNAQLFTVKFFLEMFLFFYWKVLTKDIRMTKTNTSTFLYQRSITSPTAIHYPQKNWRLLFHEHWYQHCETGEWKHLKCSNYERIPSNEVKRNLMFSRFQHGGRNSGKVFDINEKTREWEKFHWFKEKMRTQN